MDTIFSMRKPAPSEPSCPEGTFPAGYVRDYYQSWSLFCLENLKVEDIEDVINFCLLVGGQALIGLLVLAVYRKVRKPTESVQRPLEEVKVSLAEIGKANAANYGMCAHKFTELMDANKGLRQELETIKASVFKIQQKLSG